MRKQLLTICALLFSTASFSQGIQFEQGTWKEVLDKAQQTNKPIFVCTYSSTNDTRKRLDSAIFALEAVGKVFNAGFICYQIDADKGEGLEVAKNYKAEYNSSYLFIKADGTLFCQTSGNMRANDFIALSKTALSDLNDPKTVSDWDKEYVEKKDDSKFLKEYMNKRSKLGLSNSTLFDEYLKLIPEEERYTNYVVSMYKKMWEQLLVNSFAYENLQKNWVKIEGRLAIKYNVYLIQCIINTLNEAGNSKNEQLFTAAISAYDHLPRNTAPLHKDELYAFYYLSVGDIPNYVRVATDFGNNHLMKISKDSIAAKDKATAELIERRISGGGYPNFDSTQIANLRVNSKSFEREKVCKGLNDLAWQVFNKVSDKTVLLNALKWSKRSLELMPDNSGYLDTYANLLYKLGRKEEAITKEKQALRCVDKKNIASNERMVEILRKMIAGEKTWKE
ncbi:MAG: hypothetical protein NTY07_00020 [Bacteroidia bacterium]|nr:hypothetical protein [Bacteroidia bacterium]